MAKHNEHPFGDDPSREELKFHLFELHRWPAVGPYDLDDLASLHRFLHDPDVGVGEKVERVRAAFDRTLEDDFEVEGFDAFDMMLAEMGADAGLPVVTPEMARNFGLALDYGGDETFLGLTADEWSAADNDEDDGGDRGQA